MNLTKNENSKKLHTKHLEIGLFLPEIDFPIEIIDHSGPQGAEIFLMLEEADNFVALNEDLIEDFQVDLTSNNQEDHNKA